MKRILEDEASPALIASTAEMLAAYRRERPDREEVAATLELAPVSWQARLLSLRARLLEEPGRESARVQVGFQADAYDTQTRRFEPARRCYVAPGERRCQDCAGLGYELWRDATGLESAKPCKACRPIQTRAGWMERMRRTKERKAKRTAEDVRKGWRTADGDD